MKLTITKITGSRNLLGAIITAVDKEGNSWAWEEGYYYNSDIQEPRLSEGQEVSKPKGAIKLKSK